MASVTRLGDFWKLLITNLLIKVAKKECRLFGAILNNVYYCRYKLMLVLFGQL